MTNPYEPSAAEQTSVTAPLQADSQFAACPKCNLRQATPLSFTWWGGVLGPKLLSHVQCTQCGAKYNGKTGKSNLAAIVTYQVVVFIMVIGFIVLMRTL